MLVVTNKGVKIQLNPTANSSINFSVIGMMVVLLAVLGMAIAMGLSVGIAAVVAVLIIIAGFGWQKFAQKPVNNVISGGEILITPAQIEHISSMGEKSVYPLPQQIDFIPSENQLKITDKSAQPLLTITGFSEPQHATIAQAVLQGKSIKTQGKAIRMQSD